MPAGDTHIIYPGDESPWSSIRFEAHRIGCEDYEMLQKIKEHNFELYEMLIIRLFRSYTDYSLDISIYRAARKELLKEISEI